MSIFSEIAEEVDRFYERTMREPDFVTVGVRELVQIEQQSRLAIGGERAPGDKLYIHTSCGKFEVRPNHFVYSMIAPVLERMP